MSAITIISDLISSSTEAAPGVSRRTSSSIFTSASVLNNSTVDHYFGIGYSFRLDGLFGGAVGNSP
jgi:hypothetical protein